MEEERRRRKRRSKRRSKRRRRRSTRNRCIKSQNNEKYLITFEPAFTFNNSAHTINIIKRSIYKVFWGAWERFRFSSPALPTLWYRPESSNINNASKQNDGYTKQKK